MADHFEKLVNLSVSERTEYIKTLNSDALNDIVELAVTKHDTSIIRLCQKHGATKFNYALEHAAENGYGCLVSECIEWGATNLDRAMAVAAANNYIGIVLDCRMNGATDLDQAMVAAASNGNAGIVQFCKNEGAPDFKYAIASAAKNGHFDIVRLLIIWGATDADVDDALTILTTSKTDNFTTPCDTKYILKCNIAMMWAAANGQFKVVQLCLHLGASNYNDAVEEATLNGHNNISSLVKEWDRHHDQDCLKPLKVTA